MRVNKPGLHGGAYSEITFLDKEGNVVENKDEAETVYITEYSESGEVVHETVMVKN